MNHIPDQDLLLLAHRALEPQKWLAAKAHMIRCPACRSRHKELASLSSSVALAVRLGMPVWKPAGMALSVKLLISTIVVATSLIGVEVAVMSASSSTNAADSSPKNESRYLDFSGTTNPTKRAALDALQRSRGEKPH